MPGLSKLNPGLFAWDKGKKSVLFGAGELTAASH